MSAGFGLVSILKVLLFFLVGSMGSNRVCKPIGLGELARHWVLWAIKVLVEVFFKACFISELI